MSEEKNQITELNTESKNGEEEEPVTLAQVMYDLTGTAFVAITILLLIMTFFVRQVTVNGPSMNDTLQDKDRLLVSCFNYKPQTGDIVIITHGKELPEAIVKRVIATEGQKIRINSETGEVTVDGVLLKEDYIKGVTRTMTNPSKIPDVIPKGYVFVMGDNREHSADSRSAKVDLIPVENITGKAFMRVYPFEALGLL